MALESGSRLGSYEISDQLGKGGMGEVWRARDTRLGRDVAIKTLPPEFAEDADRLARFEREAKLLASLNHPNIGAIYGLEEHEGTRFLVLELVEGDTLAERLRRGAIPVEESLKVALQIAEALEAAHEKGVIHRDLKPANIKITPDSRVKVLDFGLAKAFGDDHANVDLSNSPTLSIQATLQGMILGTAAYMSPEQARGRDIDKRTDIWAFGCVLYEMLAGRQAFQAEDVSTILARVLERDPDHSMLPAGIHPRLAEVIARCLEKSAADRWHDIADVRLELRKILDDPEGGRPVIAGAVGVTRRAVLGLGTAALGGAGIGAVVGWRLGTPTGRVSGSEETWLEITTPSTPEPASVAVAPDGRSVVFVAFADGISRLWLRPMNSPEARPVAGTENASRPFWKPDSGAVGFFADGWLKRVDLDTETVQQLAPAPIPRGAAWNQEGTIVFVPSAAALWRIAERGGEPTQVEFADEQNNQFGPSFLPDGRRFVFDRLGRIWLGDLGTREARQLRADATSLPVYSPTGHVLFVRAGTLWAGPFDPDSGQFSGGEEFSLAPAPVSMAGYAGYSVSRSGTVVYRRISESRLEVVRRDRDGNEMDRRVSVSGGGIDLSPDGRFLAVPDPGSLGLKVHELSTGREERVSEGGSVEFRPVWSARGESVSFTSNQQSGVEYYVHSKVLGTIAPAEAIVTDRESLPLDWSPDGDVLLYVDRNSREIRARFGDGRDEGVSGLEPGDLDPQFSPDGGWLAYQSDRGGQWQVYVQRFPEARRAHLVSTSGGSQPRWGAPGSNEIIYLAPDGYLMSVRLEFPPGEDGDVRPAEPARLFPSRLYPFVPTTGPLYAVAPDGNSFFLSIMPEDAVMPPLTVVQNWMRG